MAIVWADPAPFSRWVFPGRLVVAALLGR